MHRTALALADAGFLAQQFGHQPAQLGALGDGMSVAAMVADHIVIVAQPHAGPDAGRFLAGIGVERTGDLTLSVNGFRFILEIADVQHAPVLFQASIVADVAHRFRLFVLIRPRVPVRREVE